jgi:hypothetical protein
MWRDLNWITVIKSILVAETATTHGDLWEAATVVACMNVSGSKWIHPVILYKGKQIKETSGNSLHSGNNCGVFPKYSIKQQKSANICVISIATDRQKKKTSHSRWALGSSRPPCSWWIGEAKFQVSLPFCSLQPWAPATGQTFFPSVKIIWK